MRACRWGIPSFYAHGSGVIVQLADPEPDLVALTSSRHSVGCVRWCGGQWWRAAACAVAATQRVFFQRLPIASL